MKQTILLSALGALAAAGDQKDSFTEIIRKYNLRKQRHLWGTWELPAMPDDRCYTVADYTDDCDEQWDAFDNYCWWAYDDDSRCAESDERYYASEREWNYPTVPD